MLLMGCLVWYCCWYGDAWYGIVVATDSIDTYIDFATDSIVVATGMIGVVVLLVLMRLYGIAVGTGYDW